MKQYAKSIVIAGLVAVLMGVTAAHASLNPPTELRAIDLIDGGVDLVWKAPAGLPAGVTVTRYEVMRRKITRGASLAKIGSPTKTTYTDNGITEVGSRWLYQVRAVLSDERSTPDSQPVRLWVMTTVQKGNGFTIESTMTPSIRGSESPQAVVENVKDGCQPYLNGTGRSARYRTHIGTSSVFARCIDVHTLWTPQCRHSTMVDLTTGSVTLEGMKLGNARLLSRSDSIRIDSDKIHLTPLATEQTSATDTTYVLMRPNNDEGAQMVDFGIDGERFTYDPLFGEVYQWVNGRMGTPDANLGSIIETLYGQVTDAYFNGSPDAPETCS